MCEELVRRGVKAPDWYDDCPPLAPGHEFYLNAFNRLTTDRQIGQGVGPIPHSKIEEYGEKRGLDSAMMLTFETVIRAMDRRYLKWVEREAELRRKQAEAKRR